MGEKNPELSLHTSKQIKLLAEVFTHKSIFIQGPSSACLKRRSCFVASFEFGFEEGHPSKKMLIAPLEMLARALRYDFKIHIAEPKEATISTSSQH